MLPLKLFLCRANLIQLKKIKVGAVAYLNTKPLIYGMQQEGFLKDHELIMEYPARLAEMLTKGELDVALVPVALLPELNQYHIVSRYCIASDEEVASVCLFSQKPIGEIKQVILDYQSKTSVSLLRILFKDYWKKEVQWIRSEDDRFMDEINNETAGLIIGDRALELRKHFPYRYDLAKIWKELTGSPFVFAVWVSNNPLPEEWIRTFDQVQLTGLEQRHKLIGENPAIHYDLHTYFYHNIAYEFDQHKQQGMHLFLEKLHAYLHDVKYVV